MHLSLLDRVLWATGFGENVALFLVLIGKKRWRTFPTFTTWIGFQIGNTILLYCLYRFAGKMEYDLAYWGSSVLDLGIQIGIIFEMVRIVLRPTGTWVQDARRAFLIRAGIAVVIAAVFAYLIDPKMPNSFDLWIEKGQLFSVMLTLELFLAMATSSNRLGLVWKNHVMGLATGWAVWAVVDFFAEGAYSYLGLDWRFYGLSPDHFRIFTYQAVTIYWIVIFWISEPPERTLSPEMQVYLSRLHQHVQLSVQGVSSPD